MQSESCLAVADQKPHKTSERKKLNPLRLACFARRPEWYWQLVRDHQIKNWGYVKKRKP